MDASKPMTLTIERRIALPYLAWEYGIRRAAAIAREQRGMWIEVPILASRPELRRTRAAWRERVVTAAAHQRGRIGLPLTAALESPR